MNEWEESLQTKLTGPYSKAQMDELAAWVGVDPLRMEALMNLYFRSNDGISYRAAAVVGRLGKQQAGLLEGYFPRLVAELHEPVHPAKPRNVLRLFQFIPVPESLRMDLMELCFGYVGNPAVPIAVRAFAITVLAGLVQPYPELSRELLLILRAHEPESGPAFRVRARDAIRLLEGRKPKQTQAPEWF